MSSSSLPPMRVVLFSLLAPPAVQAIIEKLDDLGQHVQLVVVSPGTSCQAIEHYPQVVASVRRGIDVLVTSHMRRLPGMLKALAPDYMLVAGFPRKLQPALLDIPRLGCVNWHPSLLPRYRGPEPFFWQFVHGETHVGSTFHRMDATIDMGPILVQRSTDLKPGYDMNDLFSTLFSLMLGSLPDALQAIAEGLPGTPQSSEEASYAPRITELERWLNWSHPADQLHNRIRAWSVENGAWADIEGKRVLVRQAKVITHAAGTTTSQPGAVLRRSSAGIMIQTGQDALLLEEYVYEEP